MSTALHKHTPSLATTDSRGLPIRAITYHRSNATETLATRIGRQVFDTLGRLSAQWDPRLLVANHRTLCGIAGRTLKVASVDAGWHVEFYNATDVLTERWDSRFTHQQRQYDEQIRLLAVFERLSEDRGPRCVERFAYADAQQSDAAFNRCGQMIRHDDAAGSHWSESFAVLGQTQQERRQFCRALSPPNWPASIDARDELLEQELDASGAFIALSYATVWHHDAVGALVEQRDAEGHRRRFELDIAGRQNMAYLDNVVLISASRYNANENLEVEHAGNDVVTTANYSSVDGRLHNLDTAQQNGKMLQSLRYTYDPVGNINSLQDFAQVAQWFDQERVAAVDTYQYDTSYQLISATGRENVTQNLGPALPALDIFGNQDPNRWRQYTQTYAYDSGGNLTDLRHSVQGNVIVHRQMAVAQSSNRSGFIDSDTGTTSDIAKGFDANGNQRALTPGQLMHWDARNQLQQVTQVVREHANGQDDDVEIYVYAGDGQRIRKVRKAKTRSGERICEVRYLPGLEIRTHTSGEHLSVMTVQGAGNTVRLLHWKTAKPDGIANDQRRYSVSDHLGSTRLELDAHGQLLSQESYYPYGGTSWWAANSAITAKYKTVRYSGKERDATGLHYYGFRYYAAWLQRWINPDPAGDVDGLNLYRMVRNSPLTVIDPDGRMPTPPTARRNPLALTRSCLTPPRQPPIPVSTNIQTLPIPPSSGASSSAIASSQVVTPAWRIKRQMLFSKEIVVHRTTKQDLRSRELGYVSHFHSGNFGVLKLHGKSDGRVTLEQGTKRIQSRAPLGGFDDLNPANKKWVVSASALLPNLLNDFALDLRASADPRPLIALSCYAGKNYAVSGPPKYFAQDLANETQRKVWALSEHATTGPLLLAELAEPLKDYVYKHRPKASVATLQELTTAFEFSPIRPGASSPSPRIEHDFNDFRLFAGV